ncbi:dynamin family protein [Planktothrix sp. FACHB-1355]|uniref:Dynamin family protein n=1 Tax=Aerosakkonema funiforme FACHB-1375 TaxID=2949571 RepID=A0A926VKC2_9CYAN|nr:MULTISPECIES: dynamin family protein [Oscillatoriales]MBD2185471.1 dynamin family protein [Aerosakkonema funiforme FACHB-1375]MBD3559625.1 dynamin family protein [Planktothrix sp. FACHB-1355]
MKADAPKPNVQDLQTQILELLGQVSGLIDSAGTALRTDSASEKYGKFQQEVSEAARNVEELELRMAIVAPMKAGKSTIVNAIVGQEILPSRNAAMTTLPTEIICDSELKEPTLILNSHIQQVFRETFSALQRKVNELGMERVQEKIAQYPHLTKLPEKIQGMSKLSIHEKIVGRQQIINSLRALNDIIRVCSVLDPLADPLQSLMDVPRIYTPFWHLQKTAKTEKIGKLVIVDTPGPNEAGENLRLANVVSDQLRASSVVLIVLNFTGLNTKAEEEVKKDVQKVIDLRGKDNLYVLVNKVDQRKDGDMTTEQVRQFVTAEFGLGDGDNTNRVFEISARWAFSATNFLVELEQNPKVEIAQMKTARSLAQDVFPIDWEEELEETNVEQLKRKAEKLWKKSGFDPFLQKAIDSLMIEAAPRCIISSLNITRARLVELLEDMQIRSSAIHEDGEKLREEVVALEADMQSIEECRSRLQELDRIKSNLHEEFNNILESVKKEGKISVESYFSEEEYQRADFMKKGGMKAKNFLDWISKQVKSTTLEKKYQTSIEFPTLREAEEFADTAVTYAKEKVDVLLENVRENTSQQIERSRQDMLEFLDEQTKPIVDRARERLNENFNLDLSLPKLRLDSDYYIDLNKPLVMRHTRTIDQGYTEVVKSRRSFFHYLWLVPFEVTEKIKRPNKVENFYTVSLQGIVYEVNKIVDQNISTIKQGINQYLDEDFQQRINDFFNDLDRYLSNYRDSLKQAQEDQKLSIEGKGKLIEALNSLVPQIKEQIKNADNYLKYTDNFMSLK